MLLRGGTLWTYPFNCRYHFGVDSESEKTFLEALPNVRRRSPHTWRIRGVSTEIRLILVDNPLILKNLRILGFGTPRGHILGNPPIGGLRRVWADRKVEPREWVR